MTGRRSRTKNSNHHNERRRDRSNSRERSRSRLSRRSTVGHDGSERCRSRTLPQPSNFQRDSHDRTLDLILARLTAIETTLPGPLSSSGTPSHSGTERHAQLPLSPATPIIIEGGNASAPPTATAASCSLSDEGGLAAQQEDATDRIVGVLMALSKVRSQNYYISPFDPNVHNFDVWTAEVDRAKELNGWDDRECLGRIGGSLRGDAKSWLNEWVTSDRSWTNFKVEFRSLCPRNVDVATILYDVMNTDSGNFATYAEYACKSLLRLNIVSGLSEELKVAIITRGITDPHVKAATINAKPSSKQLVEFLSAFTKPKAHSNNAVRSVNNVGAHQLHKREFNANTNSRIKCRICGRTGHLKYQCNRKSITKSVPHQSSSTTSRPTPFTAVDNKPVKQCSFCKRTGHTVETCFQKQRSSVSNRGTVAEVNFCSDLNPNVST